MKSISFLTVGFRLVGIYLLTQFIGNLSGLVGICEKMQSSDFLSKPALGFIIAAFVLHLMLILTLILIPGTAAKIVLPKNEASTVVFDGSAKDVQVALFCIMGVYIISHAIPDFIGNGLFIRAKGIGNLTLQSPVVIAQVTTVFEFIIGLCLCFKSKQLSELLWKIQIN